MRKKRYGSVQATLYASLLLSLAVIASPGMEYTMVYDCNPEMLTKKTVEICTMKFPELAESGELAFKEWQQRNSAKAALAVKQCKQELAEYRSKQNSGEDRNELDNFLAKIEAEIVEDFAKTVSMHGKKHCLNTFDQLQNSVSDVRAMSSK